MSYTNNAFSFTLYTKVLFGFNTSNRIGQEAKKLVGRDKRTLVITDRQIRKLNLAGKIIASLETAGFEVEIYAEVEPEPSLGVANEVKDFVRKEKTDLIVGFGGGSCVDIAKIASVMATNSGKRDDYLGNNLLKNKGLPKILIPTTAGTGSEVSRGAVVSIGDEKAVISDTRYGFADVAIVDPMNSISLPPNITAQSGFDALSHAIESFICTESNPISDVLALKAIELIAKSLRQAYNDGKNLSSRYGMSLAALLAGIAFENSCLTSAHVFAERIGPILKIPHGVAISLTLPIFLEYFVQSPSGLEKSVIIAKMIRNVNTNLLPSNSEMKIAKIIKKIGQDLNLPTTFSQIKITEIETQKIIKATLKDLGNMPDPQKITKERLLGIVLPN